MSTDVIADAKTPPPAICRKWRFSLVQDAVWSEPVSSLHFPDFRPNQILPEK
ncbi:hypothetical protein [Sphingobium fuliginis]|uniref:hypothetical protein n=1 Tax=Sphingobium fuliginis (strain ATCC 27551) TaxID=336203 RepID=UPI001430F692|nr:hypothetical protein [Sphingobium fuliginis]